LARRRSNRSTPTELSRPSIFGAGLRFEAVWAASGAATRFIRKKEVTIMGKLQGKVAVVTGGTMGIGFATAKRFVDEGASVFITGRRQKELDDAVKAIGSNVVGVQGDVSKLQDLDHLYETVKAKGKIDVLVANAGIGEFAPLASLTEEHFDKLFDLNVKGTLFTVQKALTLMNDGGSIILIGSVASVKGTPAFGTYGATKAAVRNLVREPPRVCRRLQLPNRMEP
jgi:NAD(P)-dependent dehydrogenase (short-subunit alcohol dehydrogenase family)